MLCQVGGGWQVSQKAGWPVNRQQAVEWRMLQHVARGSTVRLCPSGGPLCLSCAVDHRQTMASVAAAADCPAHHAGLEGHVLLLEAIQGLGTPAAQPTATAAPQSMHTRHMIGIVLPSVLEKASCVCVCALLPPHPSMINNPPFPDVTAGSRASLCLAMPTRAHTCQCPPGTPHPQRRSCP